MLFAILIGIIVGIIGFLPLAISLYINKKIVRASTFIRMATTLLCLAISFAILIASMFIFNDYSHSYVVPFVLSVAITLSIVAIAFGIFVQIRK